MVLVNVFRGVKTGKTQMNLLDEGFDPVILIEGETSLEHVRTVEMTDAEIDEAVKAQAKRMGVSPSPTEEKTPKEEKPPYELHVD